MFLKIKIIRKVVSLIILYWCSAGPRDY